MRTEVKALIAQMTAERDVLTRAIAALSAIEQPAVPTIAVPNVKRRQLVRRIFLSDDAKRAIVSQMTTAIDKKKAAKALAHEFGCKSSTIYATWRTWQRVLSAQPATVADASLPAHVIQ